MRQTEPLSDTKCRTSPYMANSDIKISRVFSVVGFFFALELLPAIWSGLTTIKNMQPKNGPANQYELAPKARLARAKDAKELVPVVND